MPNPMPQAPRAVVEPDEATAPLVFLYLFVIVACLAAIIAWVYWYRGYA